MALIIRETREEAGLSREEVARRIAVGAQALYRVETGRQIPWPSMRRKLAELFGVPEGRLFADIDRAQAVLREGVGDP